MEHEQQHPTGPTFDTLKAAQALEKAGFTGVQARAVTQAIVEAQDNLASKADIRELRAEMMGEFKAQRAENKRMEETLRADNRRVLDAFEAHVAALRSDNQRVLAAFESHVAVLRAENKRMEETLRADNKRMEGGLRAENELLKEKISTNRKLILSLGVPLLLAAVGHLFAG